jgi:hypothetical protein
MGADRSGSKPGIPELVGRSVTPDQAALMRDVVAVLAGIGYEELTPRISRKNGIRAGQIEVLSFDQRIDSTAYKSDMITYVMATYNVTRHTASNMLHRARQRRKDRSNEV